MAFKVVNIIPKDHSDEDYHDWEPNIAVNPVNPLQIAVAAHRHGTPGKTPIYVSADGGDTWEAKWTLPAPHRRVGDLSLRFAGPSGVLYVGVLDNGRTEVLAVPDPAKTASAVIFTANSSDAPYLEAATGPDGTDRVFISIKERLGNGRLWGRIHRWESAAPGAVPPMGQIDSYAMPALPDAIRDREIRSAVHPEGIVYAFYAEWRQDPDAKSTTALSDLIIVRDDRWAESVPAFSDLFEPGFPGVRIASNVRISKVDGGLKLGTQRLGASLAMAVDPTDSSHVYVAWTDGPDESKYGIHVRHSLDGGRSWSPDLMTDLYPATNPCLAISQSGQVGLMYQKYISTQWHTRFRSSSDNFQSLDDDVTLLTAPDPLLSGVMLIGDYAGMVAAGKIFYGVFCAYNTPTQTGVTYQRSTANGRMVDSHHQPVNASADPFFFRSGDLKDDFYVRDWTESAAKHDPGEEPSKYTLVWDTSDVWNRRTNAPGAFDGDAPVHENPASGDNYVFARISRVRPGPPHTAPKTVIARFYVALFGAGNNFSHPGAPQQGQNEIAYPTVVFQAGDVAKITPAFSWHLDATDSTTRCFAVEISAPGDPPALPSLAGNAPGWPTYNSAIRYDNNKATRNTSLYKEDHHRAGPWPPIHLPYESIYAVVHNPDTITHDFELLYEASPEAAKKFADAQIEVTGSSTQTQRFQAGGTIRLPRMLPGQSRWVGLKYVPPEGDAGETLAVHFSEIANGVVLNGFTMGVQLTPTEDAVRSRLERHASVMARLGAGGQDSVRAVEFERPAYVDFLRMNAETVQRSVDSLLTRRQTGDPFALGAAVQALSAAVKEGQVDIAGAAHHDLLNRLDAFLTMEQLAQGDIADVLQNVRWQRALYLRTPVLARLSSAVDLRSASEKYMRSFGSWTSLAKGYPELIAEVLPCFRETAKSNGGLGLENDIEVMTRPGLSLRALQGAHRDFLLQLHSALADTPAGPPREFSLVAPFVGDETF